MPLKPPLYISYLLKKLFKTELKSLFIVLGLYFFLQGIPNLIKLQIQFGGDFYFIIILSVSILLLTLPLFLPISSILAVFLFRYEIKKLGLFSNLELLGKKSTNVFWIKQSFHKYFLIYLQI